MKRALLALLIVLMSSGVSAASTFGKTAMGGSSVLLSDDVRGCVASPSSNGTATSMTAYLSSWAQGGGVKFALYDTSDDSFVASTAASTAGGTAGWHTLSFSSPVSVSSDTTYLLGVYTQNIVAYYYDNAVGVELPQHNNAGYPTWPDPVTTSTGQQYSVYCTYSAGGYRGRLTNGYRTSYRARYN